MSYTPPEGNNVNFELEPYTVPEGDEVYFNFILGVFFKVYKGGDFEEGQVKYWDGSEWVVAEDVKYWDGSEWVNL